MRRLEQVLAEREEGYRKKADRLRESDNRTYHDLSEAARLVACLRRMVAGKSPREIHAAFGAPGDWGYETSIGDALCNAYSEPSS